MKKAKSTVSTQPTTQPSKIDIARIRYNEAVAVANAYQHQVTKRLEVMRSIGPDGEGAPKAKRQLHEAERQLTVAQARATASWAMLRTLTREWERENHLEGGWRGVRAAAAQAHKSGADS
jgi:hypothetical protein